MHAALTYRANLKVTRCVGLAILVIFPGNVPMQRLLPYRYERVKLLAVEDVPRAATTSLINPRVTNCAGLAIVVVLLVKCDEYVAYV